MATRQITRHRRAAALIMSLLLAANLSAASAAETFKVRLTPVPIDAQTAAQITGSGAATAELDGRSLMITGSFSGLKTAATTAQLHEGPSTAVRGPKVADLTVPQSSSGTFTSKLQLNQQQVESLRQGRLYIQIHSLSAPDGNLWGWLLQ